MKYEFNVTSIDFKVTVAFTIPHLQQYTYNYTTCTIYIYTDTESTDTC